MNDNTSKITPSNTANTSNPTHIGAPILDIHTCFTIQPRPQSTNDERNKNKKPQGVTSLSVRAYLNAAGAYTKASETRYSLDASPCPTRGSAFVGGTDASPRSAGRDNPAVAGISSDDSASLRATRDIG